MHLPTVNDAKFLIARCIQISTPAMISQFVISIEAQLAIEKFEQLEGLQVCERQTCRNGRDNQDS
jgi:hypothetical protein